MSCRYDTATPNVDPVHISSIVVPGGYDLSTLNTTQVSPPRGHHYYSVPCLHLSLNSLLVDLQWRVGQHLC